jgi:hypothetical protein
MAQARRKPDTPPRLRPVVACKPLKQKAKID